MKRKKKYLVSFRYDSPASIAVDWNKIPTEIFEKIPGVYIYNVPAVTSEGDIIEKTVIYLNPVSKFESGVDINELDDIIIGI